MTLPTSSPGWEITSVPRAWHDAWPKNARPRLKLFWDVSTVSLLVLTVLCGLVTAVILVGGVIFPGPGPTGLAAGIGVGFTAVIWFLVSRSILYRGTPWFLALAALSWGATAGVVLGGFTSSGHLSELAVGWGTPAIAWSLAGAWPEETAKALGVFLLLFAGRTWWNRPWHGLVAGVLVGVGFEALENALYAISIAPTDPESDITGVLQMWLLRILAGPLLHALCTGIVGFAIGTALLRAGLSWRQQIGWVLGGWAAGFSVHALWNLSPGWETGSAVASVLRLALVWSAGAAILVTAIVRSTREARAAAKAGLYPAVTIYRKVPPPLPPGVFPGLPPFVPPVATPGLPPGQFPGYPAGQFPGSAPGHLPGYPPSENRR